MARNNQGGAGRGLREFVNELLAEMATRGIFNWFSPSQSPVTPQVFIQQGAPVQPAPQPAQAMPPPSPPTTPAQPAQPGAAAVNVMNTAANLGGQALHQVGQVAAQAVPLAQRAGRGFAATVDDAWVIPAQLLAGFYLVYTIFVFGVVYQVQPWMDGLSCYYPAATHGWYTLALALQVIAAVAVFALWVVAYTDPTPGDRLNFNATMGAVAIMLVNIPLAPLTMGSAIASAIHSARLNNVPIGYLSELYTWGNVCMIAGTVLVAVCYGVIALVISTSDLILDTLRGRNVPLERAMGYVKAGTTFLLAIPLTRYTAMLYWPSAQFVDDFLDYGLILVVTGIVLFALAKIKVELKTWQRVVIGFMVVVVATLVWKYITARHGVEVQAVETEISAQRSLIDQAWIWVKSEWSYNRALPRLSYGVLRGLGKGTIYFALFLAAGFYALGGYERIWKPGRVGQLIGLLGLLILAPCALVCLSEVLGIVLGWAHAL